MEKKLNELRERRSQALAAAKQITEAAKTAGRGLSDDERTKVDALLAEADQCDAEINVIVADLDRIERINEAIDSSTAPAAAQPQRREDPSAGRVRITGGEASGEFRHFGEFLSAVVRAETNTGRDQRLQCEEPRADAPGLGQNTVVPSSGGYLVPPNFSTMLMEQMAEESLLLPLLDNQPLTVGNSITLPYVKNTSRATGSRFGGVRAYWRQQGDRVELSKMDLGQMEIKLKDLMAIGYVTDEMLADAVFSGNLLQAAFAAEIAFTAEDAVINGTGVGLPQGLLKSPCKVEVAKESGQAADTICGQNIAKMWARMPARYRREAVWLYNTALEPQIAALSLLSTAVSDSTTATAAIPLVIPAGYGVNQSNFSTIYNRPLLPMEQCPAPGDVGDIILVAPRQYLWVTKGGLNVASSMHVRFLYNEQTFRVTFRADGQCKWPSSVSPFKGSDEISPIVTLAAR